ncbi:complement factor H-like isoform X3 [Tachysurus fulvidraco]|uniref:complement factor H-like isoform X3 n=1 Tax=Tachysurus fulvidraco TaxID=1234273 RepID=UPI001FED584E|nr:complement factor H-like isoform X3 [Tachysurus fulvidraco]
MGSNMQVAAKIFFTAFWLSFLTLAKNQVEKGACAEASLQNGIIQEIDTGRKYSYSCDKGYKAFDEKWWDVVSCTEGQWSYAPRCIPNDHCGQIPNGPAKHNQAKKGYENGATEVVGCDSNTCVFICVEGKWEKKNYHSTKCGSPPSVENAVIASYSWDNVKYLCREKYSIKGGDLIYCMDSKWEKPPTCESEKGTCAQTSVTKGFTFELDKGFTYSCDKDYKAFDQKWWDVVTCSGSQWSYTPLCIPKSHCGQIPNGLVKQNQSKKGYENGATEVFECESEPCCFKCNEGNWEEQDCEPTTCGSPPPVENAVITSYNQETVEYACRENYTIMGDKLISCLNSKWDKTPACESEKGTCAQTSVTKGFTFELDKGFTYSCDKGYKAFDQKWWDVVTCSGSQWSYTPLCIPKSHCGQIPNGLVKQNQSKKGYENGATEVFECESEPCCFKCNEGNWEEQDCEPTKCGSPPPVENAVITSYNQETVEYACRENYTIKGDKLISCLNSKWDKTPACECEKVSITLGEKLIGGTVA